MKDRWHSFHKLVQCLHTSLAIMLTCLHYEPNWRVWSLSGVLQHPAKYGLELSLDRTRFFVRSKIKWKSAKFWLHRWHFGLILLEGERECIVLEDECMTWPTVCAGSRITDCKLLSAGMSYAQRSLCRMSMIVADKSHPANGLFSCMPSGIKYRHIQSPLWHIRTECWMSLLGLCI